MRVIPKGWLKYQPMGEQIPGTRIVPFKVPLTEEVCCRVPDDQWFTPGILLRRHPDLKIVIDLTDTTKYYDPQEFSRQGIVHVKINIMGGGALPPLRKLRLFFRTVDNFMKKYRHDPDALVGVHCTHGLNRTGFFICHYMVDRLGMSPNDAIAKFEAARGHAMHRQNFINEIKNCKGKIVKDTKVDPKKNIEYTSPLGDALEDCIGDRSRRGSYSKPGKTQEDWRKRDTSVRGESNGATFRNFNKGDSKGVKYGDKKKRKREKRDKSAKNAHPCKKETSSASSGASWRDRP